MRESGKTEVFRITDLTAKRIKAPRGGSRVGYLGPDQDPEDFPRISPWVMLTKTAHQLEFLDRVDVESLDIEFVDRIALNVGRSVIAGKFFPGTALCSVDMPTCVRNQRISPVASLAHSITNADLAVLRHELEATLERIERFEKKTSD